MDSLQSGTKVTALNKLGVVAKIANSDHDLLVATFSKNVVKWASLIQIKSLVNVGAISGKRQP